MKIIHYVPPVVVLVIAAAWLAHLRGANSALEQENRSLQGRIAESPSAPAFQKERPRAEAIGLKAKREEKPSKPQTTPSPDWVSTSTDWKRLVLFINDEANYRYTAAWKRLEKLASESIGLLCGQPLETSRVARGDEGFRLNPGTG